MSYACLIAQAHHPQSGGEEFLDEIVFFDVERRAAEVRDRSRVHVRLIEGTLPCLPDALGDHLCCTLERDLDPSFRKGRAVLYGFRARRMGHELVTGCTFGAEMPSRDGRLRITFDADD